MPIINKLVTPLWGELEDVYEPREDSFFLLDTLEGELSEICLCKPSLALEIGSGSGVIITSVGMALGPSTVCLAVDINGKACSATAHTASINKAENVIDIVQGDLASMFAARNQVDLLIFNPPYVVTAVEEITGSIERSWAGGVEGTQVLNRLLPQLSRILSETGLGYFVLIEENQPETIMLKLRALGISSKIISRRKIPGEKLCVLKLFRETTRAS